MNADPKPTALLHVTDCYAGGVGRHVDDLLRELDRRRWRQTVVELAPTPGSARDGVVWVPFSRKRPWTALSAVRHLQKHVLEALREADRVILHGQSTVGSWIVGLHARRFSAPAVTRLVTPHGYHGFMSQGAIGAAYRWIDRLLIPSGTQWVAISDEEAAAIRSHHSERFPLVVIPHGIEERRHEPRLPRERDIDVLVLGRLSPQKDPRYALEILSHLPHVRAAFAGDGPLRGEIEQIVTARDLRQVEIMGFVPSAADLLARSKCLLLTSRYEAGVPYVVLEALAAGMVVVSTRARGFRGAMDKLGVIAIDESASEAAAEVLAEALRVANPPGLPPSHSMPRMIRRYEELYSSALETRTLGGARAAAGAG